MYKDRIQDQIDKDMALLREIRNLPRTQTNAEYINVIVRRIDSYKKLLDKAPVAKH